MQHQIGENQEKSGNQKPDCSLEGKRLLHTSPSAAGWEFFLLPLTSHRKTGLLGRGCCPCPHHPALLLTGTVSNRRLASHSAGSREDLGLPLRDPCPFPSSEINLRASTPINVRAQGVPSTPKWGIPQLQGFQTRKGEAGECPREAPFPVNTEWDQPSSSPGQDTAPGCSQLGEGLAQALLQESWTSSPISG